MTITATELPTEAAKTYAGFISFHHHPNIDPADVLAQTLQRAVDSGVLASFEIGCAIPHPSNPVDRTPVNVRFTLPDPVRPGDVALWDWLNWDDGLSTWYGRVYPEIRK